MLYLKNRKKVSVVGVEKVKNDVVWDEFREIGES